MAAVLLVDGHAYAYRAFHAIRGLKSAEGKPTGAIFGFIKMVGRLRSLIDPAHMAVVWDGGLSSERAELLPDYKAQRPPMPDELDGQIEELMSYLPDAGVATIQQDGVEADDLIATIAVAADRAGNRVVIASSDKDFFQLVSASMGLVNPADKTEKIWDPAKIEEKTGVRPEQIVDWLSLIGDSVDNIPGVPGVGLKTATELMVKFGSVDALYLRLAEIAKPRLRESLQASESLVRRNQKMIRLQADVPGAPAVSELQLRAADRGRLLERYRQWGFRSMAAEAEMSLNQQGDLFAA